MREPPRTGMVHSQVLKLSLLAGLALLIGLHLPSPWRSTWPSPSEPWEEGTIKDADHHGKHHDHGGEHQDLEKHKHKVRKVHVDVYGESLCPDTTHAIHDVIQPLFANGVAAIMKLRYHAYGKVQESGEGQLQCQHGPLECKINRFLNCAQELHPGNQSDWFGYVACVHGNYGEAIEAKASEECVVERGWDKKEMNECAAGSLGDKLEKKAGESTKKLGKLTFVPWILVNGVAIGHNFEPLAKYVCAAYHGERPAACTQQDGGWRRLRIGF